MCTADLRRWNRSSSTSWQIEELSHLHCTRTTVNFEPPYWHTKKSDCLSSSSSSHRRMPEVVLLRENTCGQYCRNHPTVLTLHNHIITCLMLWEKSCDDTILLIRSYRMLCACGCRRETATFALWEYMVLFKRGRRLLKTMDYNEKDYALGNAIMKFCVIFECTKCK